jgi:hypothetical protein
MSEFHLERNARGRLVYTDQRSGRVHEGVAPVRAFPIAAPDEGIALMSADGHELAWVATLTELAAPLRTLFEEELNSREFLPEIRRIKSVSGASAHSVWQVQTDRGDTELALKGEESLRRIGGTALVVTDVHGVQYLVRQLAALDRVSRKLLDRFM